jgi:ring-1,2-phenylacetyl-CoA epoxidase subunit PaaC
LIAEQPNGDFARTVLRQFLVSAFMQPYWRALTALGTSPRAIAAKAEKEAAYHLRHAGEWVIRLGDGTDESRRRMRTRWRSSGPSPARCSKRTRTTAR